MSIVSFAGQHREREKKKMMAKRDFKSVFQRVEHDCEEEDVGLQAAN